MFIDLPILTLDVKENGLLLDAVVIDGSNHVFHSVLEFHSIDDEREVVSIVTLHEFDTLLKFAIVVSPCDCWWGDSNDATVEFCTLSLVCESGIGPNDETRSRFAPVKRVLVDAVALD